MIGEKIKIYRKSLNLSLSEMARRTGLSVGYLSTLERDLTSPTFDNLCNICGVLQINVSDLINICVTFNPVVKKEERELVFSRDYSMKHEYTTDTNSPQLMRGTCLTIYDNEEMLSYGHETDEFGIVTSGSMVITIEEKEYVLAEGDSIYIRAGTTHKWRKIGDNECVTYWTVLNYKFIAQKLITDPSDFIEWLNKAKK